MVDRDRGAEAGEGEDAPPPRAGGRAAAGSTLVGGLLLAAALAVAAASLVPALLEGVPFLAAAAEESFATILAAGLVVALALGGVGLLIAGAALRRHAVVLWEVRRLETRLEEYLRVDDVPEEVRDGRLLRDLRERDARFVALENSVATLPRLRATVDELRRGLAGAEVRLFDPATGAPVALPLRLGGSRGGAAERWEPVDALEGVGPWHADVLVRAGYRTVGDLVDAAPAEVAARSELPEDLVRRWQALGRGSSRSRSSEPPGSAPPEP